MENPIPHSSFFSTPKDLVDLQEYCNSLNGHERNIAYLVSMMTFNLAYKLVEEKLKDVL